MPTTKRGPNALFLSINEHPCKLQPRPLVSKAFLFVGLLLSEKIFWWSLLMCVIEPLVEQALGF